MVAGTRIERTIVASTNSAITIISSSAAAVMIRPVRWMPDATAKRLSPVRSYCSRTRDDELADTLGEARHRDPGAPLKQRFLVTSFAFREWALEHRPAFGLLFGAPIPGVLVDKHLDADPATNRGMRFGQVWLELFAELWRQHPVPVPEADELDSRLREQLAEYYEQIGRIVPIGAVVLYLTCWMQLYGALATEVLGHLNFALHDGDAEALFHDLVGELVAKLGLAH